MGIAGLAERVAPLRLGERAGDIGERFEMILELGLLNDEKHHQMDRLTIHGFEIDAFLADADRADCLGHVGRRRVGNADPVTHSGAHGFLAGPDGFGDGIPDIGADIAGGAQVIDQFLDSRPPVPGLQIENDVFRAGDNVFE
jgi:hypothetical protein